MGTWRGPRSVLEQDIRLLEQLLKFIFIEECLFESVDFDI